MTTQTSYRIRMRTHPVDDIAGTMRPVSELNTTEAREARLSWWDTPALFGRMRTFGPHIHQQQPEGPGFWSWRDGELILAFDAVVMEQVDGKPVGTHGRSIIFDVLSSLCDEPEGTIVGGIQYEHSYDWNPIIMHEGRLRIGYVSGSELGDKERPLAVQPRIIDPDRITASDEESVHVRDVD